MPDRRTIILAHDVARQRALAAIADAPDGWVLTFSPPKRSGDQNAKFHALCGDLARSDMTFAGKRRKTAQWKVLLVSGHSVVTKEGAEIVPGIEGEFVNLRESTAAMTKTRGSSLIEYTVAFCATNGVHMDDGA